MAFKMKGFPMHNTSALKNYNKMSDYSSKAVKFGEDEVEPAFKQTDSDLKEFLISDKGFSQEDADRMMSDGSYDLDNKEFKAWYAESGKGDVDGDVVEGRLDQAPAPEGEETPMEYTKSALKNKKRGAYSAHNYAHGSLGDESDGAHNDPNWQEHFEAGEQRRKKLMSELDFEDDTKS